MPIFVIAIIALTFGLSFYFLQNNKNKSFSSSNNTNLSNLDNLLPSSTTFIDKIEVSYDFDEDIKSDIDPESYNFKFYSKP